MDDKPVGASRNGPNDKPIGVFDSGLGGLTVLKEIEKMLPGENIVYFGDCGRAPYGVKSPDTIKRYTFQNTRFFMDVGVKLLVIACNTSSAYAYQSIAGALDFPVIEVIKPGSAGAAKLTKNGRIGVIGTAATVSSRVYERVFHEIDPAIAVYMRACPLFVPLAEEGPHWWRHAATRIIAEEYIGGLRDTGIDCLVLGCTHYPLLWDVISDVAGERITLVSSARAVAAEAYNALSALGLLRSAERREYMDFYTSDSPEKFRPFCGAIMGEAAGARVYNLDIESYEGGLF